MSLGWRKAQALREICTSDDASPAQVTVIVEAREAAPTQGETGVVLEAGPRVGAKALREILCDASIEVTAKSQDGRYMEYERSKRTATPAQKRALLD